MPRGQQCMADDSAKGGSMLSGKDVEAAVCLEGGQFPLSPVGPKQDSITQAHVGKGEWELKLSLASTDQTLQLVWSLRCMLTSSHCWHCSLALQTNINSVPAVSEYGSQQLQPAVLRTLSKRQCQSLRQLRQRSCLLTFKYASPLVSRVCTWHHPDYHLTTCPTPSNQQLDACMHHGSEPPDHVIKRHA
jgi:hypothetical protein